MRLSAKLLSTTLSFLLFTASCKAGQGVILAPKTEKEHQAAQLLVQAASLLKTKKAFLARPVLERALSLWPTSAHIHFNMGLCYGEISDFPRAIAEYKQALQLDDKMTEAIPNIGTCYQMLNKPAEAIYWFNEYLKRKPNAADANQVRGMIAAISKASARQIKGDPQSNDYLESVMPKGKMERWQRHKIPLKVYVSNGTEESGRQVPGFREYYNEILIDALDTWMKASQYRLAYKIVDNVHKADIVCTWTDRADFLQKQGNAVEQGVARIASRPINSKEIEIGHARVIILTSDTSHPGSNITDDELKKACLHEIGHALGLAGHSNNNHDVMFFSESPAVWPALTKRDKATIARLYNGYAMNESSIRPPIEQPPQVKETQPESTTPEAAASETATPEIEQPYSQLEEAQDEYQQPESLSP